jgi:hypothetical protein
MSGGVYDVEIHLKNGDIVKRTNIAVPDTFLDTLEQGPLSYLFLKGVDGLLHINGGEIVTIKFTPSLEKAEEKEE